MYTVLFLHIYTNNVSTSDIVGLPTRNFFAQICPKIFRIIHINNYEIFILVENVHVLTWHQPFFFNSMQSITLALSGIKQSIEKIKRI